MITFSFLTQASPDQIIRIIELYRQAGWWAEKSDNPELVKRIISGSHCFLTVSNQEGIIGMGRAISDGTSDAYIQDVTVDKAYQGRNIGSNIIQKLVERLETDGLKWIGLIAENDSQTFYEKLGFKKMPNSVPMLNLIP
jgi:spermidine synthase